MSKGTRKFLTGWAMLFAFLSVAYPLRMWSLEIWASHPVRTFIVIAIGSFGIVSFLAITRYVFMKLNMKLKFLPQSFFDV